MEVAPWLLWSVWLAAFVLVVTFNIIFYFHWKRYDWEDKKIRRGALICLLGNIFFLLTAMVAIFIIS